MQADPSLATQQPYKAIIEHDKGFFDDLAEQEPTALAALESAAGRTGKGTTPDVFDAEVREWIATVKQPRFGVGYTALVYRPMLELFDFLKAHEFRVMVCSGGGRDFMRVFAEDLWGIFNENVIGTSAEYEYRDGKIVRTDRMIGGLALGPGKPEHIFARTGRLPIFAGGNADVDIEMLECARFALLVNHDDADREYDYVNGAEKSLAAASELGWTVVSMKNDWATVFSDEVTGPGATRLTGPTWTFTPFGRFSRHGSVRRVRGGTTSQQRVLGNPDQTNGSGPQRPEKEGKHHACRRVSRGWDVSGRHRTYGRGIEPCLASARTGTCRSAERL